MYGLSTFKDQASIFDRPLHGRSFVPIFTLAYSSQLVRVANFAHLELIGQIMRLGLEVDDYICQLYLYHSISRFLVLEQ